MNARRRHSATLAGRIVAPPRWLNASLVGHAGRTQSAQRARARSEYGLISLGRDVQMSLLPSLPEWWCLPALDLLVRPPALGAAPFENALGADTSVFRPGPSALCSPCKRASASAVCLEDARICVPMSSRMRSEYVSAASSRSCVTNHEPSELQHSI
jgi:hypothetical protein